MTRLATAILVAWAAFTLLLGVIALVSAFWLFFAALGGAALIGAVAYVVDRATAIP